MASSEVEQKPSRQELIYSATGIKPDQPLQAGQEQPPPKTRGEAPLGMPEPKNQQAPPVPAKEMEAGKEKSILETQADSLEKRLPNSSQDSAIPERQIKRPEKAAEGKNPQTTGQKPPKVSQPAREGNKSASGGKNGKTRRTQKTAKPGG